MLRNKIRRLSTDLFVKIYHSNSFGSGTYCMLSSQETKIQDNVNISKLRNSDNEKSLEAIFKTRVIPMVVNNKNQALLSFEDVPGPKTLKYISSFRHYISEIGTQLTAAILTFGINIQTYVTKGKPLRNLSTLFDEYGPVVRFVSPVGNDVVLINHPDHIQKVFSMEGSLPIRSTLDCLEKYRTKHRNQVYGGLYTSCGQEWYSQRLAIDVPIKEAVAQHLMGISGICDKFASKIETLRDHKDEMPKDFYTEIHKWAFDCMGLIVFSKKFDILENELLYSQCDISWMYYSLEKATDAINKCESGLRFWRIANTPAWMQLVKHCDSLDSLIGKHVLEAEHSLQMQTREGSSQISTLITALLTNDEKQCPENVVTAIMDLLLIGVNTVTSSMSFLIFNLAKYQKAQKILHQEIVTAFPNESVESFAKLKEETPFLQACIRETLRLNPPIPLLTRILPKNITLDRYNIPRGTMVIMSTQEAALKESNYDDATKFCPERWLKADSKEYHAFASIPFGYGSRKCLGQNIAETMLSLLTIKLIQKFKLEYHYGDIKPTRNFISQPNKPLKIRFIDRA